MLTNGWIVVSGGRDIFVVTGAGLLDPSFSGDGHLTLDEDVTAIAAYDPANCPGRPDSCPEAYLAVATANPFDADLALYDVFGVQRVTVRGGVFLGERDVAHDLVTAQDGSLVVAGHVAIDVRRAKRLPFLARFSVITDRDGIALMPGLPLGSVTLSIPGIVFVRLDHSGRAMIGGWEDTAVVISRFFVMN